ncbi:MAG: MarR family transcriptional regulator [Candidatus Thiodiazotropha sp. (ex Dulcina madagascariensis)]|nr:MarR family transcriptional regulator [Candidatus Thiodiazotropha sp. (ex Dulcina madagascariensis)]
MSTKPSRMMRSWKIAEILTGHELEGVRNGDLAASLKVSPATITTDLREMESGGVVERIPGMEDRWRMGPKTIQLFRAHQLGMERLHARVSEMEQRYTRDIK